MTPAPKVSVLMTVYNGATYLREAMDSILGQSFADFEFVIVDDGSRDASLRIVRSYTDARIRLIANPMNLGQTPALNIGLRECRGRYVARMDADDVALPDRLVRQVALLDAHPGIGIVGGAMWIIDSAGRRIDFAYQPEDDLAIRLTSLTRNPFHHPTVTLRRDVLVRHGLEFNENFQANQDFDLWTRLLPVTRAANLPQAVLAYRIHGTNISVTRAGEQQRTSIDFCARRQRDELGEVRLTPEATYAIFDAIHGSRIAGRARAADIAPMIADLIDLGEAFLARNAGKDLNSARRYLAAMALRAWMVKSMPFERRLPTLVRILRTSLLAPWMTLRFNLRTLAYWLRLYAEAIWRLKIRAPSRIDVLVLTSSLRVGGTERHLSTILPLLAERGWRIGVARLGPDGPVGDALRAAGIAVFDAESRASQIRVLPRPLRGAVSYALQTLPLVRLIWSGRPKLVHAFLPNPTSIGGLACLAYGFRPWISSRRALNLYQAQNASASWLERWTMRRADAVLGNSTAILRDLRGEGIAESRLALIHNGVGLAMPADARAAVRACEGISPDGLLLVIVANLLPYKGHLDLVEALGRVAGRLPADWTLLCVGRNDGLQAEIEARADAGGIAGRVRFAGERADVRPLLVAADLYVSASHEEGFSNSVLEAMAAGLPVIATRVGGTPDAVQDGETGLLVPARDAGAMGDAILRLAADGGLRARMGMAGRARVEAEFAIGRCVDSYDAVYRGITLNPAAWPSDLLAKANPA
ncbi:MAG: glycosyltransferase [Proteobacteria bacterium]|nr:glycosyltransferase [Pseudomonadota bacterium]